MTRLIPALGTSVLVCGIASAQAVQVEADIKPYKKANSVSGNLSSIGSDTLNNLMTLWAEGFKKTYPSVNVQIPAGLRVAGSSVPAASCPAWVAFTVANRMNASATLPV